MPGTGDKPEKTIKTSYLSTVVSMSLVLFVLGIIGLLLLTSRKISIFIRENITLTMYLKNDLNDAEIMLLKKTIDRGKFVKESIYISKQEAASTLQRELDPGEDFIQFLDGHNPLPSSIELRLKAMYANPDSILAISSLLSKIPGIAEIESQRSLIHVINDNINKINIILAGFSILLFIILLALINNNIRLAIHSKRFLIRTMHLVGASPSYVRRPFLLQGILSGIFGSFIAILFLSGVITWMHHTIPEIFEINDADLVLTLCLAVIGTGIIIGWLFSFFAVHRYLHVRSEDIY
ncbi:MAG: cell division protein FtsX [Bacteroidetes bacterium]|nr:cell division protein FtsX [Bacteroidota bacterium]